MGLKMMKMDLPLNLHFFHKEWSVERMADVNVG